MPCFVDTNVLLYAVSMDPAERLKRDVAERLLDQEDCVVSVQVLQEFYLQATRASRPNRIDQDVAHELVIGFGRFPVVALTKEVFLSALDLSRRYRFSYWDSAVIAAALTARCDRLFTEDLRHDQVIGGLRIVNPFKDE